MGVYPLFFSDRGLQLPLDDLYFILALTQRGAKVQFLHPGKQTIGGVPAMPTIRQVFIMR